MACEQVQWLGGIAAVVLAVLAMPAPSTAQPVKGCPTYASPGVEAHLDEAYRLENDKIPSTLIRNLFIVPRLAGLCAPARVPPSANGPSTLVAPTKAFDQLYYVGTNIVGVWVLNTDAGIILFDTMNDSKEAQQVIERGLRQLGLDPADIKLIILTHGHGDHWGGAKYLQDKYHARVLLAGPDIGLLAFRNEGRWPEPPHIDQVMTDGMDVILGHTKVRIYISPGHTPGSVTAIFPVTDSGVAHKVALSGGTGLAPQLDPDSGVPQKHAGLRGYIQSVERLMNIGKAAGVDAAISTHPFFDGTSEKAKAAAVRTAGQPNPWVMGREGWLRYERVILEVAQSAAAMAAEHPEAACADPKGTAAVVCGAPQKK